MDNTHLIVDFINLLRPERSVYIRSDSMWFNSVKTVVDYVYNEGI